MAKKGLIKTEVIEIADISTNVMAKMGKNQAIHLKNLEKVCGALDLTLNDVIEFVDDEDNK
jgi:DNA-binding Xre family transcriptional regulator